MEIPDCEVPPSSADDSIPGDPLEEEEEKISPAPQPPQQQQQPSEGFHLARCVHLCMSVCMVVVMMKMVYVCMYVCVKPSIPLSILCRSAKRYHVSMLRRIEQQSRSAVPIPPRSGALWSRSASSLPLTHPSLTHSFPFVFGGQAPASEEYCSRVMEDSGIHAPGDTAEGLGAAAAHLSTSNPGTDPVYLSTSSSSAFLNHHQWRSCSIP